ncbi:tRNA adenosine(34) deaminase TadA [Nakamurella lactea]|uniref:tRNA adenosine(34) deaminase TadA n=1 Tax=Nakamurella lactea TaxID=459515 RepID=UPI000422DD10|nr:tRNA adenosine(34) deaminase TadA [Nakamurella lactea]
MTTSFVPEDDLLLMRLALQQARIAAAADEVPIGAVLALDDSYVVAGRNQREATVDPTAHAEIVALRIAATHAGTWNLSGATMAVTVEPCTMCAGALVAARVSRLIFGCWEPKTGAAGSLWDVLRDPRLPHRVEVRGDVLADEAAALMRDFFARRR